MGASASDSGEFKRIPSLRPQRRCVMERGKAKSKDGQLEKSQNSKPANHFVLPSEQPHAEIIRLW
jgi:hypothetical protein